MERIILFFFALAGFLLPGSWWVGWLHRRDGFDWTLRLTLSFVWSFALFSLLAGPFLWFGGSFAAFSWALGVLWIAFASASGWLWWRTRKVGGGAAIPPNRSPEKQVARATTAVEPIAWAAIAGYFLLIAMVLASWVRGNPRTQEQLLAMSPLILLAGSALLFPFRDKLAPLLRFSADDDEPPPRLWTALAVALVLLQAAGCAIYFRPDWDDIFYLGAVLDYEHSPSFNDRDPITREPGRVNAPHRAMCLELWGAVICRLTGSDPQTLFHTLLPPPFVLAAFAAYAALFGRILPRKWIPLAMLGLSGYFLWGIGGQFGAANHFLIRIWQGKALVLHLALPLIALLLIELAEQASLRIWLSLVAAVCCALGFSSSAIFLGVVLIGCLSLALVATMSGHRLRFLALAAAACLPLVIEGAAILADSLIGVSTTGTAIAPHQRLTSWDFWIRYLLFDCIRGGCAEILWMLTLPLAALLLAESRRRAFAVYFPLVLLCTFDNPFFSLWVADHVTSRDAYYRLFWLLPVGAGWGILVALVARATAALAGAARHSLELPEKAPLSNPTRQRGSPVSPPRLRFGLLSAGPPAEETDGLGRPSSRAIATLLPLAVAIASLVLLARLPGIYVWSGVNRFDYFMFPRFGQNLMKVSPDLIAIAQQLESDPDIERHTILCGEEVTSFLTSVSPRFRYVVTRTFYLPGGGLNPELREGTERFFLNMVAHNGKLAENAYRARLRGGYRQPIPAVLLDGTVTLPLPPIAGLPRLADVPELLDRYQVEYIITSPPLWISGRNRDAVAARLLTERDELFRELRFEEARSGGEHSLWRRSTSIPAAGTLGISPLP